MSYSITSIANDCYEGTSCLINKLNIRDEKKLDLVESQITVAKISILQQTPINGNFDFEHYKAIHKFIFEDLYNWAGTTRTVDISKKERRLLKPRTLRKLLQLVLNALKVKITLKIWEQTTLLKN